MSRDLKHLTVRALAAELRTLNEIFDGPATVSLALADGFVYVYDERLAGLGLCGREEVPGDGRPFDATRAARRLLAAYRDELEEREAAAVLRISSINQLPCTICGAADHCARLHYH
jgi:hypothetical protein